MIGEISCAINRVEEQIEQLFDEKEEFIMANEDVLPRTMYLKKLAEIDSRIDELKKTLVSLKRNKRFWIWNNLSYGNIFPFPPMPFYHRSKTCFLQSG